MRNALEQHLRHRLAHLDDQIHSSLKIIRQHLSELEKAAGEDPGPASKPALTAPRRTRSV